MADEEKRLSEETQHPSETDVSLSLIHIFVVVSALGGITDKLINTSRMAAAGDEMCIRDRARSASALRTPIDVEFSEEAWDTRNTLMPFFASALKIR